MVVVVVVVEVPGNQNAWGRAPYPENKKDQRRVLGPLRAVSEGGVHSMVPVQSDDG